MENTSKETKAISRRERAYHKRRGQNKIHSALASFFAEEAAAGRITKKKLADLIEKNPAQITRWLSEASNLEIDTITEILLAMGAEIDHRIVRFSEKPKPNYIHPLIAKLTKVSAARTDARYKPLSQPSSNARVLQLETQ